MVYIVRYRAIRTTPTVLEGNPRRARPRRVRAAVTGRVIIAVRRPDRTDSRGQGVGFRVPENVVRHYYRCRLDRRVGR